MSNIIIDPNAPVPDPNAPPKPGFDLGPNAPTSPATPAATQATVMDSNSDTFAQDVVESSNQLPVIVTFWTPESEQSITLNEVLQKLVLRAGGLVKMVRMNVYENQALAQQMRVQGVPTVFAFKDGRPVEAFSGAQSEAQLQSFIDKLVGDAKPPLEDAMDHAAELLGEGQWAEAEDIYTTILEEDSTYIPAFAGIIRAIAVSKDFPRAYEMLKQLNPKSRNAPEVLQAISALELAEQSAEANPSESDELQKRVKAEPNNLEIRFELSQALFAQDRVEDAIDHLLEIVRINRDWNEQAGRKQLIKIFETIGLTDERTIEARKRLSAVLFS
ncbi:MAG: co-chaperone YbbN [Rhodospirillaceae bacterium]|nr:MAG: co-chaperone YbbN [Rhodospirillaceae bacterium]